MDKINHWIWEDKNTTESTNDDALKQSAYCKNEFFIISAQEQTKGRGRRGREWVSLQGNLFFSQCLPFDAIYLGQLVVLSSYSLYQAIENLLSEEHKAQIKWPNDILIDGKKVSGMLLEKGENGCFVVGIGVNITQVPIKKEILYPATSLKDNGIDVDRLVFLKSYINNFDMNYQQWQETGFVLLKQKWLEAVKGLDKEIRINTGKEVLNGIFKGIGDNGELLLSQNGKIKKIYAGDVFYDKEK